MMSLTTCKKCVFYKPKRDPFDWQLGETTKGACCRHPPSCFAVVAGDSGDFWSSGYPHVEPDDGCGDGDDQCGPR